VRGPTSPAVAGTTGFPGVYNGRMRLPLALVAVLTFAACGGSSHPAAEPVASTTAASHGHATENCASSSQADFPGAFAGPPNLVVGPLVMIGAARFTSPRTVREFGGNKFPLLVKAGHTATVRLAPDARRIAGLAFGPLPQGEIKLRDTYRSVTFVACRPGRSPNHADGAEITFWSGFVLTRRPVCIPLDIAVDGGPLRRVGVPLGGRC
jgi:hypothetical protein